MIFNTHIILILSYITAYVSLANIPGCSIPSPDDLAVGFAAKFYKYTYNDLQTMATLAYVLDGYKSSEVVATAAGVTDISFDLWDDISYDPIVGTATIYGESITFTNFTLELTGYYYAATAGTYMFSLSQVDDSAAVFLGDGPAFDCCDSDSATLKTQFLMFTSKAYYGGASSTSAAVELAAGTYYPIRVVYTNSVERAAFTLEITDPEGIVATTFSNVYQTPDTSNHCTADPVSSTFFHTPTYFTTSYGNVVTQTFTTLTDTTSGQVVVIEIDPYITTTVTTTTGPSLTTTTISPGPTDSIETVIVNEPWPLTTITATWTGTNTSTSVGTYQPGGTITVEVDVPIPTVTTTKTWTGDTIRTTTHTATPGETATVEVDLPIPTTTYTSTWTGTDTQTMTITASEGETGTVIVQVPTPTTTITSTWTGTDTQTTTITASEGGTGTVIVEIPTPATTITSTWTGSDTQTTTVSASESGTETVIVEVPTPTTSFTSTWTGDYTYTTTATVSGTNEVIVVVPTPTSSSSIITSLISNSESNSYTSSIYSSSSVVSSVLSFSLGMHWNTSSALSSLIPVTSLIGSSTTSSITSKSSLTQSSLSSSILSSSSWPSQTSTSTDSKVTSSTSGSSVSKLGSSSTSNTLHRTSSSIQSSTSSRFPSSPSFLTSTITTTSSKSVSFFTGNTLTKTHTDTRTEISSTVVTITSCNGEKCTTTPVTTGVTTVTVTSGDFITDYTTYCPLLSPDSSVVKTLEKPTISTTVLRTTTCDDKACSVTSITTGVSVVTVTKDNIVTEYTTFCPLSSLRNDETETIAGTGFKPSTVLTQETEENGSFNLKSTSVVVDAQTSSTDPGFPSVTAPVISAQTYAGSARRSTFPKAQYVFFSLLFLF